MGYQSIFCIKDKDAEISLQKFALHPLSIDDIDFTDEIVDGINVTLTLADYDWVQYTYDICFHTKDIGTLAVRLQQNGTIISTMSVKQFLPKDTFSTKNTVAILHQYEFSHAIFDNYLKKDLLARIENINKKDFAYDPGELMLAWFNDILQNGSCVPVTPAYFTEEFTWQPMRCNNIIQIAMDCI